MKSMISSIFFAPCSAKDLYYFSVSIIGFTTGSALIFSALTALSASSSYYLKLRPVFLKSASFLISISFYFYLPFSFKNFDKS